MGQESTTMGELGVGSRNPLDRFLSLWTGNRDKPISRQRIILSRITNFIEKHNFDISAPVLAAAHDYVTRSNLQLVDHIDELQATGEKIDASWLVKISAPNQRDIGQKSIEELIDRLEENLDSFSAAAKSARRATNDCSTKLNNTEEALSLQIDDEVSEIVAIVRELADHTRVMEDQMRRSEERARYLRADLSEARKVAQQDHLTRLPNRRSFENQLNLAVANANDDRPLCVAFCDIDRFKQFNDDYGHDTGDRVLRNVADTLVGATKRKCFVARHGGEEFAILFENTPLRSAETLLNTARMEMAAKKLIDRKTGQPIRSVTFSAGIARCLPGKPVNESLKSADDALYAAKRQGRNMVVANEV